MRALLKLIKAFFYITVTGDKDTVLQWGSDHLGRVRNKPLCSGTKAFIVNALNMALTVDLTAHCLHMMSTIVPK